MARIYFFRVLALIFLAPYVLAIFYWLIPPPSTLMIYDLATLHLPKRDWVSLDDISPNLINAVLAGEDSAFCSHFGFDFKAIEQSVDKAMDGKRYGGASTITQQTAKNLFLWNGRSWIRKLLEAPLALWMEFVLSKRRILEIYLNIAEWGPHIYGAEAAARNHFGISASRLSPQQAALLASALPNPKHMRPLQAGVILGRMQRSGADTSCLK